MKKVLVTGGCGMIGSNLVKRLVRDGWMVSVADNLWRGRVENLMDDSGAPVIDLERRFYQVDLTDYAACQLAIADAEYVVHLADIVAGIGYVFANQGEIFRVNNLINTNVFDCCRRTAHRIRGVLYVGTACSFPLTRQNQLDPEPLREDELFPAMPESAYGWSKLMGQLELGYLERETGIPCCTLMLHNVFGTPADFGERSQVIPALIRKAIRYPTEDFVVWGSGRQGRAFVHVDDVVDAICLALEKGWEQGHIQIGTPACTSIREIAEAVVRISGKDIPIRYDTDKPEGDVARCADLSKAAAVLGWSPRRSLAEGLAQCYRWIECQLTGGGAQ